MKVILLKDVKGLGKANDVVEVNDGYGRNFLLKQKVAREFSAANMNDVKMKKGAAAEHARRELEAAKEKYNELNGRKFTYKVKCGEGGKLYGAVTAMDVSEILKKEGFDVDKKNLTIKTAIKTVGTYSVKVKLHTEVSCEVTLEVEAE